jgi:geranylgeranyl diphosphate synthase type II
VQFDEATAILAGDALQPLAFQLLSEGIENPAHALKCCRYLARAAGPNALVGGQADDLAAEKGGGDAGLLARIHARKTGAMIECSAVIGALAVGAADSAIERLANYGQALGQAFQIIDDLLDVQGTAEAVGKRVGKDCQRGKLTYPGIYGLDASRQAARDYTGKAVSAADGFGAAGKLLSHLAKLYLERTH